MLVRTELSPSCFTLVFSNQHARWPEKNHKVVTFEWVFSMNLMGVLLAEENRIKRQVIEKNKATSTATKKLDCRMHARQTR